MRRALTTLLVLWSLTGPGGAGAHETQSAGAVQVTFATDAEDTLSTQGPTLLRFTLTKNGAALPGCRCRVLVYSGVPSARVAPLMDVRLEALQQGAVSGAVPQVAAGRTRWCWMGGRSRLATSMRSACGTPSARHRKHHLDGVRVPCPVGQFCLVNWTGHCASWRLPRRGCGAHAADMRPLVYSPCRWRGISPTIQVWCAVC